MEKNEFEDVYLSLLENVGGLMDTTPVLISLLQELNSQHFKAFHKFIDEKCDNVTIKEGSKSFNIPARYLKRYNEIEKDFKNVKFTFESISRHFFVATISMFDVFIGDVMRVAYKKKPEKLHESQKQLTIKQLTSFKSIAKAKKYIMEEEIDFLLRCSHSEQVR